MSTVVDAKSKHKRRSKRAGLSLSDASTTTMSTVVDAKSKRKRRSKRGRSQSGASLATMS
eukprot:CAMPEP_0201544424 /NCGR_PEP_ID=MMETSP0173_2-20130828/1032_1 /ASSEMBLY_ACC=CAM_ASM_000268 /TAXON_ID=218659 /ORGANISM="Vexillifera sp., Strain DIVA3 564/2" /LENGTH=59 /DNA_ID=CAMNT_0047952527 /DNA_START=93 /DNA_END=269 /DNA_ORIENTATION=+